MKFLFVLFSTLTGFFLGLLYGGLTLPDGSGLAGGAIVLFSGIIGAGLALLISLFVMNRLSPKLVKRIDIVMGLLLLIPIGWVVYRLSTKPADQGLKPRSSVTQDVKILTMAIPVLQNEGLPEMGLGMVKPDFYNKKALYFYGPITEGKSVDEHVPYDSITFKIEDHHQYSIGYAPPWFVPAHLKMDYEMLYLKLIALGREWAQVEVNGLEGRTAWVAAREVEVLLWPDFLLTINSIENLHPQNNPLRVKPLTHAGLFSRPSGEFFLIPVLIKEDWVQVVLRDSSGKEAGRAWLRWREGSRLLVGYSLLS